LFEFIFCEIGSGIDNEGGIDAELGVDSESELEGVIVGVVSLRDEYDSLGVG
jgi:hypothetical protein